MKLGIRGLFFPQRIFSSSSALFSAGSLRLDYPSPWKGKLIADAERITGGFIRYYSVHWMKVGNPPDWFLNPFSGSRHPSARRHWTKVTEFCNEAGDIKNIWEASRFEWVVTLARAYSVTGNGKYLRTVNEWLRDWSFNNPLNTGPNWRCGQEASVRVLNLAIASEILESTEYLHDLVYAHLERISGNIYYAISQDNNHGTSEAAGLFIGGSWLASLDNDKYPKAAGFAIKGRKWIENRVEKLVEADGGFSQYSTNYHRVLVDTLTFTEHFRTKFGQTPFSSLFYEKAKAAVNWLYQIADYTSGASPNLGANDGSLLNQLHQSSYRDFRPSLQLAGILFLRSRFFSHSGADEPLYWLNKNGNRFERVRPAEDSKLLKSGYVLLKGEDSKCLIRFPMFRFRPSHNDVFHFDLSYRGFNIICDAGTFSYNPKGEYSMIDLRSVRSHNTVGFDDQEQMPLLSRFLIGNWIKPDKIGEILVNETGQVSWEGIYTDHNANIHKRQVSANGYNWVLQDTLSGNFGHAIIGFNINDDGCSLSGNVLRTSFGTMTLPEEASVVLDDTYISEYYNEIRSIRRVKATVIKPGKYTTIIQLNS